MIKSFNQAGLDRYNIGMQYERSQESYRALTRQMFTDYKTARGAIRALIACQDTMIALLEYGNKNQIEYRRLRDRLARKSPRSWRIFNAWYENIILDVVRARRLR